MFWSKKKNNYLQPLHLQNWNRLNRSIINNLLSKKNNISFECKTFFYANSGRPIIVHNRRIQGINLQTSHLFLENGSGRYALREKLHIQKSGLSFLKSILSKNETQKISDFFKQMSDKINSKQNELFSISEDTLQQGHCQLLLISYSNSSGSFDHELSQLSDNVFGEPHQAKTLFSIHFGETSSGLEIFNPEICLWEKNNWKNNPMSILIGQEARALGLLPTTHRICSEPFDDHRFSMIMEKINVIPEKLWKKNSPTSLIRRKHSASRQKKSAIIIWDQDKNTCKDWIEITRQLIDLHLFYFRRASQYPIFLASDLINRNNFDDLKGADYALIIEPHFLLKSESDINHLYSQAESFSDLIFHYFEPHLSLNGVTLMNLNNGFQLIRNVLECRPSQVRRQYPNSRVKNVSTQYSHDLPFDVESSVVKETCQIEKQQISTFIEEGFSKIFVFNTEPYDEVINLTQLENVSAVIGLASGFKSFFIAAKLFPKTPNIYIIDSNQKALKFWENVHKSWDGQDFPAWFVSQNINAKDIYQVGEIEVLWKDELEKWGGAEKFKLLWNNLKKCTISYHYLDFLDLDNFLNSELQNEKEVLFWISNVWDNEYMYFKLGDRYRERFLDLLKALAKLNCQFRLFGSPIFFQKNTYDINDKKPHQILKELGNFN